MVSHRSGYEDDVFVLAERAAEASESTTRSHCVRLSHFIRWYGERNIESLNELTGDAI